LYVNQVTTPNHTSNAFVICEEHTKKNSPNIMLYIHLPTNLTYVQDTHYLAWISPKLYQYLFNTNPQKKNWKNKMKIPITSDSSTLH